MSLRSGMDSHMTYDRFTVLTCDLEQDQVLVLRLIVFVNDITYECYQYQLYNSGIKWCYQKQSYITFEERIIDISSKRSSSKQ